MYFSEIYKKYNMPLEERMIFIAFIKSSKYKYSDSVWRGLCIDDSEDIERIITDFRERKNTAAQLLEEKAPNTPQTEPPATAEELSVDRQSKLIPCPDCGKEVSRRATVCIHCGCPLEQVNASLYNVVYKGFPSSKIQYDNQINMVGAIRQLLNVDLSEANRIVKNPPHIVAENVTKDNAKWIMSALSPFQCILESEESASVKAGEINARIDEYISNGGSTIICPRCGSNQITVGQRGFSMWTGFLGSQKTTNRCGKCGHSWQP